MRKIFCVLAGVSMLSPSYAAEALRYKWQPGKTFVYEVEMVADEPNAEVTYKGRVEYTVNVDGKLQYKGGLKKTEKKKAGAAPRTVGPYGAPPGFARMPFGPGGPFTRRVSAFKGLEQTTNLLELNAHGGVISIAGSSHVPYLLGHLSLLPFESLDVAGAEKWEVDGGVVVSEAKDRVEPLFPVGGPFAARNTRGEPGKRTSGGQVDRYRIVKSDEAWVEVEKTAQLETAVGKDGEKSAVKGKGTWTFNRKQQLPEALEYMHTVIYSTKNQTVKVPVSIRFHRMSDEAWGKVVAQREAEQAKRKQEHEKRMAERKVHAEAALTPEETVATLKDLESRSAKVLAARLKMLAGKTDQAADARLAGALRALITHPDKDIRAGAENALAQFDPAYQELHTVLIAYRKGGEVAETSLKVSPDIELPLGLIVLYREHRGWAPGMIVGEAPGGTVELKQVRWPHRERTATRDNLRLADRRAEQPHVSPQVLAAVYGNQGALRVATRAWTDASGDFQVEGTYQRVVDGVVHLVLANGKQAEVPLDKLSVADRAYVKRVQQAPRKQNPFKILD